MSDNPLDFGTVCDDPTSPELTHKQAVRRMAKWLQYNRSYTVVIAELSTSNPETPDVLGFSGSHGSLLIEVKVSRADFLADRSKRFRIIASQGMGDRRYFAAPKGLLKADEMPDGWGLLEITTKAVYTAKEAAVQQANKGAEVRMLTSAIRRLEISTAVFVRQEPEAIATPPMCPPTPPEFRKKPAFSHWKCERCGWCTDFADEGAARNELKVRFAECPHDLLSKVLREVEVRA